MSKRQRPFTPTIADSTFDKLIKKLADHWGIEKQSQIITLAVIEAAKKVK
jgi:hypothetical protein